MYTWMLFETNEKCSIAELKIAENMSNMFPANPQAHYANVNMLTAGAIVVDGKTVVCGFIKPTLEMGYTPAQVTNYLADVEWDAEADYSADWFEQEG